MGRPRTKGQVVARDAICIVVGARPPEYEQARVYNTKREEWVMVDLNPEKPPVDEGSEGQPYTFRAGEKVRRDHPAVLQSPHAFVEMDEAEDLNLVEA